MTAAAPNRLQEHEPERVPALDGVRGLAILLVLLMHGLYIAPLLDPGLLAGAYAKVALLGWCGVDVFFVLSGFLITGILVRSKGGAHYFRNFYARRALRIFPLYYLVVGLLLYVLPRPPVSVAAQLSYLLYYQNWQLALVDPFADFPLKITWSLAIEEQFYLLWPALVWLVSARTLRIVCAMTVVAAIALRLWLLDGDFAHTHFLTPCRMDALAAGALLAVSPKPRQWFGWAATGVGVGGLVATALASGSSVPEALPQQRWGLLAASSLGVGLLSLARGAPACGPLFRLAPLRSLGKYSYCIYLTHMLVIEWLAGRVLELGPERLAQLTQRWSSLVLVLAFTLATIAGSWLLAVVSWNAFERWFLRLKRRFPNAVVDDR
ncbi:MAG: acyltransferase [Planctomycetes bacterium]|nr:acyltransferase [Planctomycetota bacterium]